MLFTIAKFIQKANKGCFCCGSVIQLLPTLCDLVGNSFPGLSVSAGQCIVCSYKLISQYCIKSTCLLAPFFSVVFNFSNRFSPPHPRNSWLCIICPKYVSCSSSELSSLLDLILNNKFLVSLLFSL